MELKELYQDLILDHAAHPRNSARLSICNHEATGHNRLCGDQCRVTLLIEQDIIKQISINSQGCAISKASASLMSEHVKDKNTEEAKRLTAAVLAMLKGTEARQSLGKLLVFKGMKRFPGRVKCAALAWHTLVAALASEQLKGGHD